MKVTPRKGGQGKAQKVKTQAEVHAAPTVPPESVETPASVEAPAHTTEEAPPTLGEVEKSGGDEVRRGVEVTRVISLTVVPDGHRGWAINVGRGGAS